MWSESPRSLNSFHESLPGGTDTGEGIGQTHRSGGDCDAHHELRDTESRPEYVDRMDAASRAAATVLRVSPPEIAFDFPGVGLAVGLRVPCGRPTNTW